MLQIYESSLTLVIKRNQKKYVEDSYYFFQEGNKKKKKKQGARNNEVLKCNLHHDAYNFPISASLLGLFLSLEAKSTEKELVSREGEMSRLLALIFNGFSYESKVKK